ncbi:MAG: choice-of-anchor D domain-containing protein [Gammaproteobacteria bacterium]|nr:choice-of-anchor D domain-containing protein [Gammaproteobacteria bacterium]
MKLPLACTLKPLAAVAAAALTIAAAGCNGSSSNNAPPALAFIAPPPGATAEVGKAFAVTLDVTRPAAFANGIYVVGQGGLGTVAIPTEAPYTATLAVPADLALGSYTLTAVGTTGDSSSGRVTASTTIEIIPNPAIPIKLQLPQGGLVFEAIGERLPITVPGATKGLEYRSSTPAIATVSKAGIVTAQSAGTASISVSLDNDFVGSVPIKVLAPALLPAPASLDFADQAAGTTSAAQTVTVTNSAAYPVKILAVTSGTVFPVTGDCLASSPLAPGASCTLSVNFAPNDKGDVNGALTIAGSAVIARTRILLSGTGT